MMAEGVLIGGPCSNDKYSLHKVEFRILTVALVFRKVAQENRDRHTSMVGESGA